MLTGISPFYGDGSEQNIIHNTKTAKLNFNSKQWNLVSDNAKDFVGKLLTVEVKKRMDTDQSFAHDWIYRHKDKLEKIYLKKILSIDNNDGTLDNNFKFDWKRRLPKYVSVASNTSVRTKKVKRQL
ncbi:hypothetical protein Kpol_1065p6, partial [Vanderwaltozyma polyspora DSM 70294]